MAARRVVERRAERGSGEEVGETTGNRRATGRRAGITSGPVDQRTAYLVLATALAGATLDLD